MTDRTETVFGILVPEKSWLDMIGWDRQLSGLKTLINPIYTEPLWSRTCPWTQAGCYISPRVRLGTISGLCKNTHTQHRVLAFGERSCHCAIHQDLHPLYIGLNVIAADLTCKIHARNGCASPKTFVSHDVHVTEVFLTRTHTPQSLYKLHLEAG